MRSTKQHHRQMILPVGAIVVGSRSVSDSTAAFQTMTEPDHRGTAGVVFSRRRSDRMRLCLLQRMSPLLARLRHADCVEQCPSSRQSGKHVLVLSSSQFDPKPTFRAEGDHSRNIRGRRNRIRFALGPCNLTRPAFGRCAQWDRFGLVLVAG